MHHGHPELGPRSFQIVLCPLLPRADRELPGEPRPSLQEGVHPTFSSGNGGRSKKL